MRYPHTYPLRVSRLSHPPSRSSLVALFLCFKLCNITTEQMMCNTSELCPLVLLLGDRPEGGGVYCIMSLRLIGVHAQRDEGSKKQKDGGRIGS